ncbi:hypothetical protein P691DRAFT_49225 [Macrolepiota fuliginosa MF-IS2]|uniref:Secreted protein n=1 Tax=Macrolepiota fuliginosa MF-IS2 TaxID=1400762 RepID=A0A9P5XCC9_9AGAR|nr:hypothetical protein P691DRAFT_49225 [Macrolepiota fuliginosa MF-IS2]
MCMFPRFYAAHVVLLLLSFRELVAESFIHPGRSLFSPINRTVCQQPGFGTSLPLNDPPSPLNQRILGITEPATSLPRCLSMCYSRSPPHLNFKDMT